MLTLEQLQADPTASDWLKRAAREAIDRDPVDAVAAATWLAEWLRKRLWEVARQMG